MPKTLDVLIGLATIMLFFSLAVTTLTQIVVGLFNLRGRALLVGIVRLLQQVWPQLNDDHVKVLADYVLRHPAIAIKGALGNVVHREELVMLLLEAAAGETPAGISKEVRQSLLTELGRSGIPNPQAALTEIRDLSQQLEQLRPDLAHDARLTQAILKAASGRFTAKLFGWFDQTVERVSELFTKHARIVSFCGAVLITAAFQIDTIWITQRLTTDDATRAAIVREGEALAKKVEADQQTAAAKKKQDESQKPASPQTQQTPATTSNATPVAPATPQLPAQPVSAPPSLPTPSQQAGNSAPTPEATLQDLKKQADEYAALGLIQTPFAGGWRVWLARFTELHVAGGCLITVLLLSLGAPFWFNVLKNLIRLKSVLASRDDDERDTRQSSQTSPGSPFPVAAAAVAVPALDLAGERGDLNALG